MKKLAALLPTSETTPLPTTGSRSIGSPLSVSGSEVTVNAEAATKRLLQDHRRANEQRAEVCLARDCDMSFNTVRWGAENSPMEMKLRKPRHGIEPKWNEGLWILQTLNAPCPQRLANTWLMELAAKTAQPRQADESAEMRMEVYRRELSNFPADVVKSSLEELGRECTFFPSWHEVSNRCRQNSAWRRAALACLEDVTTRLTERRETP